MSQAAWEAIKAEADRLGLPQNYVGDLEIDRLQLVEGTLGDPPKKFFYALRTNGTHVCTSVKDADQINRIFHPRQVGGEIHWYRWNGETLTEYPSLELAINAAIDERLVSPQ